MYPLWNTIVEPAMRAAQPKRIVEIGALRGDTTVRLLESLGEDAELHVIDPVPQFDPTEHARRFPGRYVFHRQISHDVLPGLEPCDVALVDGDHNWYTVYHELRMLAETAQKAGRHLPLLILHDVVWPYGRRDLYYTPERIPAEFRQPYGNGGMVPGTKELVANGLNPQLDNAVLEGGPRNGVMTALEDFMAEHPNALRRVVVPIYYGLALVAEEAMLDDRPGLRELLDHLESPAGRFEQLELAELVRAQEQVNHHRFHFQQQDRFRHAADRYLELLKKAVLDELYPENELRVRHLVKCLTDGKEPSPYKLGDPGRYMWQELRDLQQERRAGDLHRASANGVPPQIAFTDVGRARLDHLHGCLETLRTEAVRGDMVEAGTGRGGTAVFIRGFLEAQSIGGAKVWVADRFGGGADAPETDSSAFPPGLNIVREAFARFDLLDDRVRFLQGDPGEQLAKAPIKRIALARVDEPDPEELRAALDAVYDRIVAGGYVVVDGYGDDASQAVVDDFRASRGITAPLERVDWRGACWRKTEQEIEARAGGAAVAAPTRPTATKDLSVIVVVHDMRREAARTLHSLSRAYQQGIEGLDYEVLVVENGSSPDQRLGEEFVSGFGPEFRYVDLGDASQPSPAAALNRGIELSGGATVALMIDGAHVLTPGVLRYGMLGIRSHTPAVVTTQQWYVGPGQQPDMVAKGYDRDYEDRLFERISWPQDGYRLFEVGHFIGDRDWFDGQWESNCVFVPRALIEQCGELDEGFSMPGGGFVNLDFFERMGSSPDVTLVSILGEGSFHQVHGGTTTNAGEATARRNLIAEYNADYLARRGRSYHAPAKTFHYVGSLTPASRRTRARRLGAPEFFKAASDEGLDARPAAVPIPDDVRDAFVDAFWHSREWKETRWMGKWTSKAPSDLLAYQDLIVQAKPDWIVETGTGGGGRAFFLATICDLVGHGQVLSVGDEEVPKLAEHPRITYVRRDPLAGEAVEEIRALVGERPHAAVILAAQNRERLLKLADLYKPLVRVGSYLVFEDTIFNGNPVWPGFGPGPREAARDLVHTGEFEPDPAMERFGMTFNPGGFLRRVR